ncbi:MAG: sulfatase [Acidobacteriota bacterium]
MVLIVIDTLRADHLGLYGYPRPTSPNLDSWARRGVVFDQAYSSSPWTLPTFGSILTGLVPSRHGAGERARDSGKRWKRAPLRDSVATLPEALAASGWQTAAVVSNPFLREHFGLSRGFQIYDYERGRTATAVIDRSLELIEQLRGRPFLLMVHLIDPHLPYRAPKPWRGTFADDSAEQEIGKSRKEIIAAIDELSDDERQAIIDRYDEEVLFVDHEVGRFLDALERQGLLDDSLIALTADHGEELFDRGYFEHGHAMHQELLRVPLILWSSNLEPRRESAPFSLVDLAQTLYVATQAKPSTSLPGRSRWTSIRDAKLERNSPILAENTLWSAEQKALVIWPYKLIVHEKSGTRELYDLGNDPMEQNDLARTQSDLADRLQQELFDRLAASESESDRESLAISEETEQELRSLGYLD